jgi:DivIVA domain-containing protein
MRRKKGTDDAPATGARITPEEVQQVEFRLAFRGYNERDVDAFLDRITEGLSSYLEELERMRLLGQHPQAVTGSTGDAGEMVARARAEADEIVRRAHEQAAGIRAAAGTGSGDTRGVVAPFLNREREFLQSLGGLVQTHAEEIKQMVLAIRERAEASPVPDERATASSRPQKSASRRSRSGRRTKTTCRRRRRRRSSSSPGPSPSSPGRGRPRPSDANAPYASSSGARTEPNAPAARGLSRASRLWLTLAGG